MSTRFLSPDALPRRAAELLDRLRSVRPRIHCLMNTVAQKLVADGLSALNAIASMTSSAEEIASFVRKADALSINLGTLDERRRTSIALAVDAAAAHDKPWVLDPAYCDYSPGRARFADEMLARGASVLRANEAEFTQLSVPSRTIGVRTGKTDRVALGASALVISNGHPLTAKVTGTGCLSGALIAAFLAVADDRMLAAASAILVLGIAAEQAGERARGPGSFEPALLDALAALGGDDIITHARIHREQG